VTLDANDYSTGTVQVVAGVEGDGTLDLAAGRGR
jgi:hypothetical protein